MVQKARAHLQGAAIANSKLLLHERHELGVQALSVRHKLAFTTLRADSILQAARSAGGQDIREAHDVPAADVRALLPSSQGRQVQLKTELSI